MELKLTKAEKIKILNSDDLYGIMQRILLRENKIDRNREHFWVVGLEINNRILFIELASMGSVDQTLVKPMDVFSFALQKRAAKVILVHNHPSGELKASEPDKDITDQMIQVGIIVNTQVIDSLIISEKSYLSFEDTGLMGELRQSIKYVPPYILYERWLKQTLEEAKTKAEKKALISEKKAEEKARIAEKKAIAKELRRTAMPIALIAEITGLSIKEIEKIPVENN